MKLLSPSERSCEVWVDTHLTHMKIDVIAHHLGIFFMPPLFLEHVAGVVLVLESLLPQTWRWYMFLTENSIETWMRQKPPFSMAVFVSRMKKSFLTKCNVSPNGLYKNKILFLWFIQESVESYVIGFTPHLTASLCLSCITKTSSHKLKLELNMLHLGKLDKLMVLKQEDMSRVSCDGIAHIDSHASSPASYC